jgi:surfactin synthase thioesterase subunit
MITGAPGLWIVVPRPHPAARQRLLCFPHAGGGTAVFRGWPALLPQVEVCVVSLPGRASRIREPFVQGWEDLLSLLADWWRPGQDLPFAFFGHCFGALLAFELTRRLCQIKAPLPGRLFLSGLPAPQLSRRFAPLHHLPDREFIEAVGRRYNSVPDILLQDEDRFAVTVPPLKEDFRLYETYQFLEAPPLPRPITAYGGQDDPIVRPQEMLGWADHTTAGFSLETLPGDHFSYLKNPVILLDSIRLRCESAVVRSNDGRRQTGNCSEDS